MVTGIYKQAKQLSRLVRDILPLIKAKCETKNTSNVTDIRLVHKTPRSKTLFKRVNIPFAFKNAHFEWVDFCEGLGVEPQEESSLSRFYNDALREKMKLKIVIL